jgi:hypothetical protein
MASAVHHARQAELVGLGRVEHGASGHDLRLPSRVGHPLGYTQGRPPDRLEKPDPTGLERTQTGHGTERKDDRTKPDKVLSSAFLRVHAEA